MPDFDQSAGKYRAIRARRGIARSHSCFFFTSCGEARVGVKAKWRNARNLKASQLKRHIPTACSSKCCSSGEKSPSRRRSPMARALSSAIERRWWPRSTFLAGKNREKIVISDAVRNAASGAHISDLPLIFYTGTGIYLSFVSCRERNV